MEDFAVGDCVKVVVEGDMFTGMTGVIREVLDMAYAARYLVKVKDVTSSYLGAEIEKVG